MHKPDLAALKRLRPVIAAVVLALILLAVLLPRCHTGKGAITASGSFEVREIELSSRVASRVTSIDAQDGASVARGGPVITLDDRLVKAQRASAEALDPSLRARM